MKITFYAITKTYLVLIMLLSILFIFDKLTEKTSQPVVLNDNLSSIVIVLKKGAIFNSHWQKL